MLYSLKTCCVEAQMHSRILFQVQALRESYGPSEEPQSSASTAAGCPERVLCCIPLGISNRDCAARGFDNCPRGWSPPSQIGGR